MRGSVWRRRTCEGTRGWIDASRAVRLPSSFDSTFDYRPIIPVMQFHDT